MMVLLVVVAIGLLSLSTIALRSSSIDAAEMRARANAKMALMLAIDRLQLEMGPDQRISANAAILNDSSSTNPQWVGVWNSWKADGDTSGHSTIEGTNDTEMHPTYEEGRANYFRSWLVSLPQDQVADIDAAQASLSASRMPTDEHDAAILIGEGTLGENFAETDQVKATLVGLKNQTGITTGRYSWWVGDESQKAAVLADSYASTPPNNDSEKIYRSQAPGSTGTTSIDGLEGLTDDSQLAALPTLETLDLVNANRDENDETQPADAFHTITPYSYTVLADVREGGLKRDLSTLLERPIDLSEDGEEFMLYSFDDPRFPYQSNPNDENRANSRVPIQDLAAYYQLYDHQPAFENGRRGGVQYSSSSLSDSLQVHTIDYDGGNKNQGRLIREYTSLYRRPVVTKIQFLVGVTSTPVTQADRDWVKDQVDNPGTGTWSNNMEYIRPTDTLKLKLGIQPLVTLWNPNNLPLVMEDNQILRYNCPPVAIKIRKYRHTGETVDHLWMNLGYANNPGNGTSNGQGGGKLLSLRLAKDTVTFEPGEVKVFSIASTTAANLTDDGNTLDLGETIMDVVNEWDPYGAFLMRVSAPVGHNNKNTPDVLPFDNGGGKKQTLVFNPNDKFTISIDTESANTSTSYDDGRNGSRSAEIAGGAFSLYLFDEGYRNGHYSTWADALRHDILLSRYATSLSNNAERQSLGAFYRELMLPGFPGGEAPVEFDDEANAIAGTQLKVAGEEGEMIALMDFSLSIGCEASNAASGGFGGGRRITSRPFLHSATTTLPLMPEADKTSLYDYGLDWQVSKINAVEDSILQAKPGTGNGYYGGGYTIEKGTTHVIQNEIPVLPPISIASLSHAYLGGFSMAKAVPVGEDPENDAYWFKNGPVKAPTGVAYQRTTASGQNGLAPRMGQATGNSYAHPNIPADKAFTTKERTFNIDEGSFDIPYVDHSYLANKALWDEFFFSSITPQLEKIELFGGTERTAKEVADDFFQLSASSPSKPLPNRRIQPYRVGLDQEKLDALFDEADLFTDGLADKIAAHLMVRGAFNINSTSIDAWRILLSSLKGKPVAYLDSGAEPKEANPDGTTVSYGALPNTEPIQSADISSPNTPASQWTSGRELTDDEITELATAIVKQVKLRGPFLSLSEFVNRRLESGNPELSKMGALQAALNDTNVSINANFRQSSRSLDAEASNIPFEFSEAAEGPIAYGSTAYVDQADILRNFAGQLTPRGDTFVIRAYGDSLDPTGKVEARAWCEAVIQRIPEYIDTTDGSHMKTEDLSATNQNFGRKFLVKSFRWLNSSEI